MLRGDMYLVNLFGNNVNDFDHEQNGLRPCVIIQNDVGNTYSPTTIVAVMTSNLDKNKLPTHVKVGTEYGVLKKSMILFEQIYTVDKCRLTKYIGHLPNNVFDNALKISLGV